LQVALPTQATSNRRGLSEGLSAAFGG
jgi:hypothetical protein